MNLVLDASAALAWLFERHKKDEAECADRLLLEIQYRETVVPYLWHTEIVNALLVAERRKVVTEAQVLDYLNRLSKLPIITDENSGASRRELIIALAREHELTAYDATYLDLALRSNAALATFDSKLIKAAYEAGGQLFT